MTAKHFSAGKLLVPGGLYRLLSKIGHRSIWQNDKAGGFILTKVTRLLCCIVSVNQSIRNPSGYKTTKLNNPTFSHQINKIWGFQSGKFMKSKKLKFSKVFGILRFGDLLNSKTPKPEEKEQLPVH